MTSVHPFKVVGCYDGFIATNGMARGIGVTREDAIQKCNKDARALEASILRANPGPCVTVGIGNCLALKPEVSS